MKRKKTTKIETTGVTTLELSPLQRFLMLPAFRGFKEPFENAEQGRLFRRAYDKVGLRAIGVALDLNGGRLAASQVNSTVPASFVLDFHEAQMLKRVLGAQSRDGSTELILGPVADVLEDAIAGKATPAAIAAPFDPRSESWDPPREGTA